MQAQPNSDQSALVMMEIGYSDDLSLETAKLSAVKWLTAIKAFKPAALAFSIGGYDDDPRSLWEIPEVCRFVQWWSQLVKLDTIERVNSTPWIDGPMHMAVLARCGAFGPTIARQSTVNIDGPCVILQSDAEPPEHRVMLDG